MAAERNGPPKEVCPGSKSGATLIHTTAAPTTSTAACSEFTAGGGRYADGWREVYARGFRDALRLAARNTDDPAVWVLLDGIADRYGLAA